MALNLLRNARLFVSTLDATSGFTKSNTWEIPILGDFSFSQANEVEDITLDEAGATPTRGSARFNTALNPVEWSFTSYMRPYKNYSSTAARAIERILWHGLVSDNSVAWNTAPITSSASSMAIAMTDSNVHKLTELFFYIKADNAWYKISKVQVNQAEISFDISAIGQIAWSGMGTTITNIAAPTFTTGATAVREYSLPAVAVGNTVSVTGSLADHIVQKYTVLNIKNRDSSNADGSTDYNLPITGGTLTINNNVTFLTPETLGRVNTPVASFTGSREITGTLSCYLRTGGTYDAGALMTALQAATSSTTNNFIINFKAGGASAPYVEFEMGNAMISIPTMDTQGVLSMNMDFKALPYTDTASVAQASFVAGKTYKITTVGTTNWTGIGAPAATQNTWFKYSGATITGTGGIATLRETDLTAANELTATYYPLTATTDANDTD